MLSMVPVVSDRSKVTEVLQSLMSTLTHLLKAVQAEEKVRNSAAMTLIFLGVIISDIIIIIIIIIITTIFIIIVVLILIVITTFIIVVDLINRFYYCC